jgi:hypothetical protein
VVVGDHFQEEAKLVVLVAAVQKIQMRQELQEHPDKGMQEVASLVVMAMVLLVVAVPLRLAVMVDPVKLQVMVALV